MGQSSNVIRSRHHELMDKMTGSINAILEGRAEADPKGLAHFLKTEVLPHTLSEERCLFPVLDTIMRDHGKPTAAMSIDNEYIEGYIDWIVEISEELQTAYQDERPELQTLLRQLCLQLEAVMQVHTAKEERAYFPLFEEYLTEDEQKHILDSMQEAEKEIPTRNDREPLYAHY